MAECRRFVRGNCGLCSWFWGSIWTTTVSRNDLKKFRVNGLGDQNAMRESRNRCGIGWRFVAVCPNEVEVEISRVLTTMSMNVIEMIGHELEVNICWVELKLSCE
jgi:hypothetical protein